MIKLKLICPQCFKEMEWTGKDFGEMVNCSCGYSNEAWYFWHTTIPTFKRNFEFIYSRGAHYENDILNDNEDTVRFLKQFLGSFEGIVHGGNFDVWIYQNDFEGNNPNNGKCKAMINYWFDNAESIKKHLEDLGEEITAFTEWLKKKYQENKKKELLKVKNIETAKPKI